MKQRLSSLQAEVVYWIEQQFWTHGHVPTNEVLAERYNTSLQTVKNWFESSAFREALVTRGVDLSPVGSDGALTPVQLQLANILLNAHDNRSEREKLKEVGISSQQFHVWLRQPQFQNYLRKRAEAMFSASDYKAFQALGAEAAGGDVSALKLFFEMRGIYNPRVQVDVNIEVVLSRVVEIIATHVRDPLMLQAIAADIESLDIGRASVATPSVIEAVAVQASTGGFEV